MSVATRVKMLKNPSDLKTQVTETMERVISANRKDLILERQKKRSYSWELSEQSLGTMPSSVRASPGES